MLQKPGKALVLNPTDPTRQQTKTIEAGKAVGHILTDKHHNSTQSYLW